MAIAKYDIIKYGPGIAVVRTKDGVEYIGPIWAWKPEDNYLVLSTFPNNTKICFDDIEFAGCYDRVSIHSPPEGEYVDQMERAREDLKMGRAMNWYKKEVPIYDWEKK